VAVAAQFATLRALQGRARVQGSCSPAPISRNLHALAAELEARFAPRAGDPGAKQVAPPLREPPLPDLAGWPACCLACGSGCADAASLHEAGGLPPCPREALTYPFRCRFPIECHRKDPQPAGHWAGLIPGRIFMKACSPLFFPLPAFLACLSVIRPTGPVLRALLPAALRFSANGQFSSRESSSWPLVG